MQLFQALGYPEQRFPANAVVSRRRPVAEVVRILCFVQAPSEAG